MTYPTSAVAVQVNVAVWPCRTEAGPVRLLIVGGIGSTIKPETLAAIPPAVSTRIGPVAAPLGTVASIRVDETSVRAAVTLFYLEEKDYTEVAGVLGIPMGTLKTHLHRARAMLREALAQDGRERGRDE